MEIQGALRISQQSETIRGDYRRFTRYSRRMLDFPGDFKARYIMITLKNIEKEKSTCRSIIDNQGSMGVEEGPTCRSMPTRVERCPYCKQKTFNNPCGHCGKLRPEVSILTIKPVGYVYEYGK
jgi:hypothetical protein